MLRWEPPGVWCVPWVMQGQAGQNRGYQLPLERAGRKSCLSRYSALAASCPLVPRSLSPAFCFSRGWSCVWDVIWSFGSSFLVSALICTLPEKGAHCTLGRGHFQRQGGGGWQTRMGPTNHNCPGKNPGKKLAHLSWEKPCQNLCGVIDIISVLEILPE